MKKTDISPQVPGLYPRHTFSRPTWDIFSILDGEQFQHCFIAWASSLVGIGEDVIAIDGKTLRRSYQKSGAKAPIHMISAWSTGQNLVLGQAKVADKSNEITAIPKLLDLLTIKGATVTIDAMGCQHKIARKIIDKGANYILALKGNQGSCVSRMLSSEGRTV